MSIFLPWRLNPEVSGNNLNLSPSDSISTVLNSYLASDRKLEWTSELEAYTGCSLVGGRGHQRRTGFEKGAGQKRKFNKTGNISIT